ncbi:hypothetical protein HNP40_000588 [Mycobacteroides chelonae]|nr:hypothetical protein [Mycobacteroides chelonae]
MPVQGASVIEIGPVGADDVEAVRRASADRRCRVTAVASTPQVAEAVALYVDAVSLSGDTAVVRLAGPSIDMAVHALSDPSAPVLADLIGINHHLVGFLRLDRITMAGNMIGMGTLYLGLAWMGSGEGCRWARNALLMSGLMAFLTYFYSVVTGVLEPPHTLVVVVLFPMLLLAVWRAPSAAHWPPIVEVPESQRRRALWGQLLMIGGWNSRRYGATASCSAGGAKCEAKP